MAICVYYENQCTAPEYRACGSKCCFDCGMFDECPRECTGYKEPLKTYNTDGPTRKEN